MRNVQSMVREFHEVMNVPILDRPTIPSDERMRLRSNLIAEEFFEYLESVYDEKPGLKFLKDKVFAFIRNTEVDVSLPDVADSLADLAYVIEGTNLEMGIDGLDVLTEVHMANMRKTLGPMRADGKRLKPPGWEPPDIVGVLNRVKV